MQMVEKDMNLAETKGMQIVKKETNLAETKGMQIVKKGNESDRNKRNADSEKRKRI